MPGWMFTLIGRGICAPGSTEDTARAISRLERSERPYASGQGGTWLDAASQPMSSSSQSVRRGSSTKPFAVGDTPSWLEGASTPL